MRRSHTQNSIYFKFSCYDWPENYYSGIFKITEEGCKFRFKFKITDPIWRLYTYTFSRENQGFWSGKHENYYSMSVWGITTNLITSLNSAIENPILQSHTWCFDRIYIIPYSFVRNILKDFSPLVILFFFLRFELKFIGIYFFDDIYSF